MNLFGPRNKHPLADLAAYADGELSPPQNGRVEGHLADCAACREELADLRTLSATLRSLPEATPPRSFALKPSQVARPVPAPERGLPAWAAMRIAGAGVAAVFAFIVVLDTGGVIEDSNQGGSSDTALRYAADGDSNQESLQSTAIESPKAEGDDSEGGDRSASTDAPVGSAAGAPGPPDEGSVPAADPDGSGLDDIAPSSSDAYDSTLEATPTLDMAITAEDDSAGEANREGAADAISDGNGDGLDAILLVEIALGVLAALAIGGSFLISRARERV